VNVAVCKIVCNNVHFFRHVITTSFYNQKVFQITGNGIFCNVVSNLKPNQVINLANHFRTPAASCNTVKRPGFRTLEFRFCFTAYFHHRV